VSSAIGTINYAVAADAGGFGLGTEKDVENFVYVEGSFSLCTPESVLGRNECGQSNSLSNVFYGNVIIYFVVCIETLRVFGCSDMTNALLFYETEVRKFGSSEDRIASKIRIVSERHVCEKKVCSSAVSDIDSPRLLVPTISDKRRMQGLDPLPAL
jgi:hypothetical protein